MAKLNPIKFKREDTVWIMRPSVTGNPKILGSFKKEEGDMTWTAHFMQDVVIAADELEQIAKKLAILNMPECVPADRELQ